MPHTLQKSSALVVFKLIMIKKTQLPHLSLIIIQRLTTIFTDMSALHLSTHTTGSANFLTMRRQLRVKITSILGSPKILRMLIRKILIKNNIQI